MATTTTTPKTLLQTTLTRCMYDGANFGTWSRELKSVFKLHEIEYVLYKGIPTRPSGNTDVFAWKKYELHKRDSLNAKCLMLTRMEPKFQVLYDEYHVYDIYQMLLSESKERTECEKYETFRALIDCKPRPGMSDCVLEVMDLAKRCRSFGMHISPELEFFIILRSAKVDMSKYIKNFSRYKVDQALAEIHKQITIADANEFFGCE